MSSAGQYLAHLPLLRRHHPDQSARTLSRRTIESLTRSLNNLLERLHASGFLYLMTSVDTFISATNYLAAPLLIGAGLTIDGLLTWSKAGGAAGRERPVLTVVGLLAVVLLVGAAELAVVTRLDPERPLPVRFALMSALKCESHAPLRHRNTSLPDWSASVSLCLSSSSTCSRARSRPPLLSPRAPSPRSSAPPPSSRPAYSSPSPRS